MNKRIDLNSPDKRCSVNWHQRTEKKPVVLFLCLVQGSVSVLESDCGSHHPHFAGLVNGQGWVPALVQLPPQIPSLPGNHPCPTPAALRPTLDFELKREDKNIQCVEMAKEESRKKTHQCFGERVLLPCSVGDVSTVTWQTRAHGQRCRRVSVSDAAGGHADGQRQAIRLQTQHWCNDSKNRSNQGKWTWCLTQRC